MMRFAALFALLLTFAAPAMAVDLPQNRPNPDRAALAAQLDAQRAIPPGNIQGFVHIPDQNAAVLVQPLGRTFRDYRTLYQPWIDAALIVVALGCMVLLYVVAGPMRVKKDPQGRTVKRFTLWERFVHWFTAASFLWLSLTGLNLVFGRTLLQPLIGDDTFASLSALLKLSHNSVGLAFIAGITATTIQWMSNNIPSKLDWLWVKSAGGMFGGPHPPARKFNAGQKMIYWIAVFGGAAISITGVMLLIPFYVLDINGMQLMQVVHGIVAGLMMAVIIGHIYLGWIGVRGSLDAMATGRVDYNWAHEHHNLWLAEEEAKGGQSISPPSIVAQPAE